MKESDILAVAEFAASLGFKRGFAEATDTISLLAEKGNSLESRQLAELMAKLLGQFAEEAHNVFMKEGLRFKVVFDADGSATIQ